MYILLILFTVVFKVNSFKMSLFNSELYPVIFIDKSVGYNVKNNLTVFDFVCVGAWFGNKSRLSLFSSKK